MRKAVVLLDAEMGVVIMEVGASEMVDFLCGSHIRIVGWKRSHPEGLKVASNATRSCSLRESR